MAKRKKRKQENVSKQHNRDSCLVDGCYYMSLDGCSTDFDGGCFDFDFDGGCLEFDGGCLDIGDGCAGFDGGCAMMTMFPLRLFVITGLMLYGDWDFKNHRAKSHNM